MIQRYKVFFSFKSAVFISLIIHILFVLISYSLRQERKIYVDIPVEFLDIGSLKPEKVVEKKIEEKKEKEVKVKKPETKKIRKVTKVKKEKKTKLVVKKISKKEVMPVKQESKNVVLDKPDVKDIDKDEPVALSKKIVDKSRYRSRTQSNVTKTQNSFVPKIKLEKEFPFAYYLRIIQKKITNKWEKPFIVDQYLYSVIYFRIQRDGSISDCRIHKKSGNKDFDYLTLRTVKLAGPFPELPDKYNENYLGVYFGFEYRS